MSQGSNQNIAIKIVPDCIFQYQDITEAMDKKDSEIDELRKQLEQAKEAYNKNDRSLNAEVVHWQVKYDELKEQLKLAVDALNVISRSPTYEASIAKETLSKLKERNK